MGVSIIDIINRIEQSLTVRIVDFVETEQRILYEGTGEFVPMELLNEEVVYMQPEYNEKMLRLEIK